VNLKEIREEINSALDYNPDLKQYDDRLSRVINRHYLQISSQYQWLFMQKRHVFILRQDITAGSADTIISDGGRLVTLSTSTGAGVKNLPSDIVGQTLVIDNIEYLITHYRDARSFVVDSPVPEGNHASWTIKYITYPMPRDSIEIMGIMDRGIKQSETLSYSTDSTTSTLTGPNRGRFMFLDARKEEYLYLDRADTGEPFVSIEEMHSNLRPPDYAPFLAVGELPTGLVDATAIPGATYEYCYTFLYAGKESPPSEIATATINEGTSFSSIRLQRLFDTRANYSSASIDRSTGRYKKIYRRIIKPKDMSTVSLSRLETGVGPWRHIATVGEGTTAYADNFEELTGTTDGSGSTDAKISPSGDLFDHSHLNEIGPRQYLRFWYTPKSDYPVEARYHRRPLRLVNDADCPEWPVQYHHYLVYAALKDISMQHGMATYSQLYEARAQQLMERMKSKYLSRTDRMYIRRGFDRAMADRERFGIPSKS
tara:strand:+ start:613 stop:2064 length:1452 start_codon:yes stop_codon:yes gene_type:complete